MAIPSANELTNEQQDAALQKLEDIFNREDRRSTKDYVVTIKNTMFFRPGYNWDELLTATPTIGMLLAAVVLSLPTKDAEEIRVLPPSTGFTHLSDSERDTKLSTCLAQCVNAGLRAFNTARGGFDMISMASDSIPRAVNDIINMLRDPEAARRILEPKFRSLTSTTRKCQERAMEVEREFDDWLETMLELHRCIVQTSSDTAEKHKANELHFAAAQTRPKSQQEAQKIVTESLSAWRDSLGEASRAYREASETYPGDWDFVKKQFVGDLGESVTTALHLAMFAAIDGLSAPTNVGKSVNIFKGDNGGAEGGSVGDGKQDHSQVSGATSAPFPSTSATLPYSNDPAYAVIGVVGGHVMTLSSLLNGGDNRGVDWEVLKNGLGALTTMMDRARRSFQPSSDPPSKDLLSIFEDFKNLAAEVERAADAAPAENSEQVTTWQATIEKIVTKAVILNTDSKNLTQTALPPAMTPLQTDGRPSDKTGALRQQIIDATITRLSTSVKVTQTATQKHEAASNKLASTQQQVGQIQAELQQLQVANLDLNRIKAILVKNIEIVICYKAQLNGIVNVFSAMSTLVGCIVEDLIKPIIANLARGDSDEVVILNQSYMQFQQQMMFNSTLFIHALSGVFRDISAVNLDIYQQYIAPGLELVNQMTEEYSSADSPATAQWMLEKRYETVAQYSRRASEEVQRTLSSRRDDILNTLSTNAAKASETLNSVGVWPSSAVSAAIEEPSARAREAAFSGIKASNEYLTRRLAFTT